MSTPMNRYEKALVLLLRLALSDFLCQPAIGTLIALARQTTLELNREVV